jgi:hypothetical protein
MFSFQRYSVHYDKQPDTELAGMGEDKASLPFSFSLNTGRKEKPLTNENVNVPIIRLTMDFRLEASRSLFC